MSPYQGNISQRPKEEQVVRPAREESRETSPVLSSLSIGLGHLFSSRSVDVSNSPEIETIFFWCEANIPDHTAVRE
jgi:hypothetical protein